MRSLAADCWKVSKVTTHITSVCDLDRVDDTLLGLPLTSIYLLEYSSEYLNEYSSTR